MELQCAGKDIFFSHFGSCCDGDDCSGYEGEAVVPFDSEQLMADDVPMDSPLERLNPENFEVVKNEPSSEIQAATALLRKNIACLRGCTMANFPAKGSKKNWNWDKKSSD